MLDHESLIVEELEWVVADPLVQAWVVVWVVKGWVNTLAVNPWVKLGSNADSTDELVVSGSEF